jgi:2-succinyl-5-enolpyruvyl-6-hydroxy-3-cyclohexene-1-carboxylate synthase
MTATATYTLLRALVDEFARCGMRQAVTAPGSRNTPIVLTLAREPRLQTHSHIDERAAGFFALGAAKAGLLPVAVTCTSGTAAANLLPAVIEAHEASVPLIVLTADRPPELRDIGAGQTIDQLKLFGDAAKWFAELDLGEATPERLRWIRALACRAYFTALQGRPGPVHLNLPLREPLVLDGPLADEPAGGGGRPDGAPWTTVTQAPATATVSGGPLSRAHCGRPVRALIVAGELGDDGSAGTRLAELADRAGLPLLADPLSGARRGPAAIAAYDLILRDPETAAALAPELVIRVGGLPTSKPLRTWLAGLDGARQLTYTPDLAWHDPNSVLAARTVGPIAALLDELEAAMPTAPRDWLSRWQAAEALVASAIEPELARSGLSEPVVARTLAARLPPEATLFIAASMPIRDVEEFASARDDGPRMLSNRGANGIDGTVSAAFGAASAQAGPVVLLIGDVALAHDLGGLLAARRTDAKLTIVLLNNDGGGIFHFLPVASQTDVFEQHVATPPGLDFTQAATLYGLEYTRPATLAALNVALSRALRSERSTLIELRTERVANRQLHATVEAAALAALRA